MRNIPSLEEVEVSSANPECSSSRAVMDKIRLLSSSCKIKCLFGRLKNKTFHSDHKLKMLP